MPDTAAIQTEGKERSTGQHEGTEQSSEALTKADVFELLSAERRQQVLLYLDGHGGTATIGELADELAALECDCPTSRVTSQQRKRVYVALYQSHLPKLAAGGAIEYDVDRGTIEFAAGAQRLLEYLHFENDEDAGSLSGRLLRQVRGAF